MGKLKSNGASPQPYRMQPCSSLSARDFMIFISRAFGDW